jgi:hypothetical protein
LTDRFEKASLLFGVRLPVSNQLASRNAVPSAVKPWNRDQFAIATRGETTREFLSRKFSRPRLRCGPLDRALLPSGGLKNSVRGERTRAAKRFAGAGDRFAGRRAAAAPSTIP